MKVLELGCGNGDFWLQNLKNLPKKLKVILSDNSQGVLSEAQTRFSPDDNRFDFRQMDMEAITLPDHSVDLVIANHVLFYASDITKTLTKIRRILKPGGTFICSTYGPRHMKEISDLVKRFDDRIILAAKDLYEIFGKTNGKEILSHTFNTVEWREYEDSLMVTDANDLTDYITSCHGNQNQYIIDRFKEFKAFVRETTGKGFYVTKEAGIFICRN
jgi:ubiquinone/menaquinone biosynthesis C-methylase UbiE